MPFPDNGTYSMANTQGGSPAMFTLIVRNGQYTLYEDYPPANPPTEIGRGAVGRVAAGNYQLTPANIIVQAEGGNSYWQSQSNPQWGGDMEWTSPTVSVGKYKR
jgi:hypothetical protein